MRVLVVEDDRPLGLFLQKGLKLEGHEVCWVGDGLAALSAAAEERPDLVVLDLSLPGKDGTEVLAELRARHRGISILVLSGRGQATDRIQCLNQGADDFVAKPFSFHELTARCRAILRRSHQPIEATLRFGPLEIDRMQRTVRRDGCEVELTGKEYALLEFLLLQRGRCCSRGTLLREVWEMSPEATTNVVDVYINYLRRKLSAAFPGGADMAPPVIETLRGEGYRLVERRKPMHTVSVAAAGRYAVNV